MYTIYHSEIGLTHNDSVWNDIKSLKSRHCCTQCEGNNDESVLFYYSKKEFPRKMPLEAKTLLEMSSIQKAQFCECQTRGSAKITVSCGTDFNLSGKTLKIPFPQKTQNSHWQRISSASFTFISVLCPTQRQFLPSTDKERIAQSPWNWKKNLLLFSIKYQCTPASLHINTFEPLL